MILFVKPKRADIVPKVRPVDMRSVVYTPAFGSKLYRFVNGRMPMNLVAILITRNTKIKPADATTALKSTRDPAFKK